MMLAIDAFEPARQRIMRWSLAAVLVVAAHVGCTALAMMQWSDEADDDAAASPVFVEMAVLPAPPRVDSPDVAHGPLMEEAQESTEASEETKPKVEEDSPPVDPSPLAPEPEVVLPKPQPVKDKPEETQPQEEKPQQQAETQVAPAPLTAAPPKIDSKEEAPAAPSRGSSAAHAHTQQRWERALVSHLNRFKRYPESARSRGSQGSVMVSFSIDREGRVISASIQRSSGSSVLDEEGLAVLQRASPLPAPPAQMAGARLDLTLPIQFRIR